jgi:hypothetical protein
MTYKPLMETRGEELLTLYLADFHAKTLAQPAKAQELKETNPQCGNTWQGSLARLDPNTSLWKTAQCSLLEDLELSLQTFPRWGLMRNGALYQLPTLVETILEKGFGLEQKQMWPTPIASKGGSWRGDGQVSMVARNVETYEEYLMLTKGSCKSKLDKYWPTPCNRDYKGAVKSGKRITKSGKTQNYGEQLPNVVGGQLNPTWVEWLMGWPAGWTDLKPLEMDKSLCVPQQHGSCSNE